MPNSYVVKQNWSLSLIAVFCISMLLTTVFLISHLVAAHLWVKHTLNVIKEDQQVLIAVVNCDILSRAYFVNGDPHNIDLFISEAKTVPYHIDKLRDLVKDNPEQLSLIDPLNKGAEERIAYGRTVIDQKMKHPEVLHLPLVSRGRNIESLLEMRRLITTLREREESILAMREKEVSRDTTYTEIVLSVLVASIVATLFWMSRTTRHFLSEQTRINAELVKARNEALLANTTKTRFIANVSHEVRTPISGMIGLAEILKMSELDGESLEIVEHIFDSGHQILNILNDLLDLSKIDSGKFRLNYRQFELKSIVDSVARSVSAASSSKGLNLAVEIPEQLTTKSLCGDPDRIRQILLNLVQNAVKYTNEGGLSVKASTTGEEDAKLIVRFEVSDTGVGIAPDDLKTLFEAFVQVEETTVHKHDGVGLGLSISKELVELMGGRIGALSEKNKGSTFWFELPLELGATTKCSALTS
jgi:signal transduction histidine kinase